jgi:hypothetical protein
MMDGVSDTIDAAHPRLAQVQAHFEQYVIHMELCYQGASVFAVRPIAGLLPALDEAIIPL